MTSVWYADSIAELVVLFGVNFIVLRLDATHRVPPGPLIYRYIYVMFTTHLFCPQYTFYKAKTFKTKNKMHSFWKLMQNCSS